MSVNLPDDVDLTDPAVKVLVCEGDCNPNIDEYDQFCERATRTLLKTDEDRPISVLRDDKRTAHFWVKDLVHTPHLTEDRADRYVNGGWCRRYVCMECGHPRFF
jgi:hypothetical protein